MPSSDEIRLRSGSSRRILVVNCLTGVTGIGLAGSARFCGLAGRLYALRSSLGFIGFTETCSRMLFSGASVHIRLLIACNGDFRAVRARVSVNDLSIGVSFTSSSSSRSSRISRISTRYRSILTTLPGSKKLGLANTNCSATNRSDSSCTRTRPFDVHITAVPSSHCLCF